MARRASAGGGSLALLGACLAAVFVAALGVPIPVTKQQEQKPIFSFVNSGPDNTNTKGTWLDQTESALAQRVKAGRAEQAAGVARLRERFRSAADATNFFRQRKEKPHGRHGGFTGNLAVGRRKL